LDAEYMERVRAQREARRVALEKKRNAGGGGSNAPAVAVAKLPEPEPDAALMRRVGVDDAYMARLKQQKEERERLKQAKALKAKAWSSAGAGGSNALAGAVTPAKTLTLEDFDGDEEKFYEATYEQRAREQAAQRALVAKQKRRKK
jgi:hypothetical protein